MSIKRSAIPALTFFITICMLSANMAAVGSLASGFVRYFSGLIGLPEDAIWAACAIALAFVAIITIVNLIGITESVVANVVMTFIEISGLVIVIIIGVIALVEGVGDPPCCSSSTSRAAQDRLSSRFSPVSRSHSSR